MWTVARELQSPFRSYDKGIKMVVGHPHSRLSGQKLSIESPEDSPIGLYHTGHDEPFDHVRVDDGLGKLLFVNKVEERLQTIVLRV